MSRSRDLQRVLHHYREITDKKDVDMVEVARFAVERLKMALPKPVDPMDRLARELSRAAREETRVDQATGLPYRANHMFVDANGQRLWLDVDDEAPRHKMLIALQLRREQMVGDAWQLANDSEHWSATHPREDPIQLVFDFSADVAERRAMSELDEDPLPSGAAGAVGTTSTRRVRARHKATEA